MEDDAHQRPTALLGKAPDRSIKVPEFSKVKGSSWDILEVAVFINARRLTLEPIRLTPVSKADLARPARLVTTV